MTGLTAPRSRGEHLGEMPRHTSLVLLTLALACGGSDGSGPRPTSPPGSLDPNVPPVTAGTWYQPLLTVDWQWQLTGTPNLGYAAELYDLDLYETAPATVTALHGAGRTLVCYFSAGSYEDWRPDVGRFLPTDLGGNVPGWPGERWLDIRSANVQAIMLARLDTAVARGCDGVEPDWLHNYQRGTGFAITATDQRAYNRWLANAAHTRGLAIALKNDLDQIPELVDYFDFAVNEQCHQYDECGVYAPFVAAGKPVLNAEYKSRWATNATARDSLCTAAAGEQLRTLVLPVNLDDAYRYACP